ncbi:MAG: muropeptide transporter AmpG [Syntrophus sp. (in: bacteria)]|nr:muropeptide transporter AmpG [Syntrophus sp. (in: bacteria)]
MFTSRRMAVMVLLGFSQGLPLPLVAGSTLQAWLTTAGVDLKTIGLFSLVGLPYVLKFLWSPFMDRFVPPWLGRRRGWIVPIQVLLLIGIALMALSSPERMPLALAVIALTIAFISASQDIVTDAYRTDVLPNVERGLGSATFILGWRLANLVAGALALILADSIGWRNTYFLMALFMIIGICGTFLGQEPAEKIIPPKTMEEAIWGPLKDFFLRKSALLFILLIILYKLGDAYAASLTTTFLIRGVNFTLIEIGTINKTLSIVATIVGALFGGTLMVKLGLYRSLMIFGILQTVSNLAFMGLAMIGKNLPAMITAVAVENVSGGMGTAAFGALIMALCDKRYSATQFALLSSFAALGRVAISPTSGFVVTMTGWPIFFLITTFVGVPGLVILRVLRNKIDGVYDA